MTDPAYTGVAYVVVGPSGKLSRTLHNFLARAAGELTDAQVKKLYQALGETISWT